MKKNVAVVLGATGQDGALLCKCLLDAGFEVFGTYRRGGGDKFWRLNELGISETVKFFEVHIEDATSLTELVRIAKPQVLYALAGQSYVADSHQSPETVFKANLYGTINVLNCLRFFAPECKAFFASSSEIFGVSEPGKFLNEESRTVPQNPYGISKLASMHMVRNAREVYGLPVSSGIMFNHESHLRGRQFVTRKISFNMARLSVHGGDPVLLGTFDAARDWSAAEDVIDAILKMNSIGQPGEFVIASGQLTSIRELLLISAEACGFNAIYQGDGRDEKLIDTRTGVTLAALDEKYLRAKDTAPLSGDSTRIREVTGWEPKISFDDVMRKMCRVDISRWKKGRVHV
jgi:GDPmannose 4,6-dehydratase